MLVRRTRSLVLALGLLGGSACMAWHPTRIPTASGAADSVSLRGDVRVTRLDGGVVKLDRASVVHDSVVGWAHEGRWLRRQGVPRSEIARVDRFETDGGRTALLVLVPVGAFVGLLALAAATLSGLR